MRVWFADERCLDVALRGRQGREPGAHDGCGPAGAGRASSSRRACSRRPVDARARCARSPGRRPRGGAGARRRRRAAATRGRRRVRARSATGRRRGALVGLRRGLRDRELRRPAGDLPGRRGRRGGARRVVDCWASFFSERALFYREQQGLARRPAAWRSSCSGWSRRETSPACSSPSTRCSAGATGWSSRRCSGSASRSSPAQVTPDHYAVDRERPVKRERLANGGVPRSPSELERARGARLRARGALRRPAGHRVGDRGRRALPAPVAAGDDAVSLRGPRASVWIEPYWNARAPRARRATGCSSSSRTRPRRCGSRR